MRFFFRFLIACGVLCGQPTPQATANRFFDRVIPLVQTLRAVRLAVNHSEAVAGLPQGLVAGRFQLTPHEPGGDLRVGAVKIPITGALAWKRFESADGAWIDILRLNDGNGAAALPPQWRQTHTGTTYPDAFAFITLRVTNGWDSVGAIVARGQDVLNLGVPLPFRIRLWDSPTNSVEELAAIDAAVDRKPPFEYRELPGNIAYIALNTFSTDAVVKSFEEHFDRIRKATGLVIDVRENGGGSSENGCGIVARLIEKGVKVKGSTWRTRDYQPALRAWGQPEGWREGTPDEIEGRGEAWYAGPVAVLIGPNTFSAAEDFLIPLKVSKRATLVGAPSAGSTGQPLIVPLYQALARICSKWDRFPDGAEFVGVGVQPDVLVERTIASVAAGRDLVLEKALEILSPSK